MIVLDASAAFEWLLETPTGARVDERIFSRGASLHAPHLIDVEVAQVLRRYAALGIVTASRARGALQDLIDLPLIRYAHDLFLPRIWELRENFTAYDAAYVALAETLGAPLVTCDRKVASASLHHARVEVI
ncbi:MAG TPA: type II toxin-antitoxin system VapC family toxin [Candidatus Binataceae bacterium]|nr:type II toxin-antitoxin system VapC family toxin [Candidatus Binataceae bacterium]